MSTPLSPTSPGAASRRRLVLATVAAMVLSNVPGLQLLLAPVRTFVTFIHEGCHALVTLATGGAVERIEVMANGNGLTTSLGGMPVLITMAGYIGTSAFGAFCLMGARRQGNGRSVLAFMAMVVLTVTALWTRNGFGFFAGVGVAGVIGLLAWTLRGAKADLVATVLSVLLCANALMDLQTLLLLTTATNVPNDAVFMSQMVGLPPALWAVLWAVVSLAITVSAIRYVWAVAPRRGRRPV